MKIIKRTSKLTIALLVLGGALTLGGLTATSAAHLGASPALVTAMQTVAQKAPMTSSATPTTPGTPTPTATGISTATSTSTSSPTSIPTSIPAFTATSIATATPSPSSTSTSVPTTGTAPLAGATATVQKPAALPSTAKIAHFPSLAQSYNLSCEYAAASAVTLYWGKQVTENTFLSQVPSNPNPHVGFRGDINGSFGGINDYGIYAEPLVPVLQKYGYDATVFYGGVSQLKANVAAGKPVVVWITVGKYTPRTPVTASYNGNSFTLVPGEHALVIYGYDTGGVYMMNVADGLYYYTEWPSFLPRWSYFDQMALVITPK